MQEQLLQGMGPQLPFPHSSGVGISRHSHMRELPIQSHGDPLRVFYAFDPSLSFILEKGSTLEATVTWGGLRGCPQPRCLGLAPGGGQSTQMVRKACSRPAWSTKTKAKKP